MLRRSRPASEGAHSPIWLHRDADRAFPAQSRARSVTRYTVARGYRGGRRTAEWPKPCSRHRSCARSGRLPHRPDRARLPVDGGRPRRRHSAGRPGRPAARAPGQAHRRTATVGGAEGLRLDSVFLCTSGVAAATAAYFAGIPQRSGVGGGIGLLLTGRVKPRREENQAETLAAPRRGRRRPSAAPQPRVRAGSRGAAASRAGAPWDRARRRAPPGRDRAGLRVRRDAKPTPRPRPSGTPSAGPHLANQLAQRHGAGILVVGSAHDRSAAEHMKIDLSADATDLVGEIDLATLAGVLSPMRPSGGQRHPASPARGGDGHAHGRALRSHRRRTWWRLRSRSPGGPGAGASPF